MIKGMDRNREKRTKVIGEGKRIEGRENEKGRRKEIE